MEDDDGHDVDGGDDGNHSPEIASFVVRIDVDDEVALNVAL